MNLELGIQFAHQLLLDTPAINDRSTGIRNCYLCQKATQARAGEIARRLNGNWEFKDDFIESSRTLPNIRDVVPPMYLVEDWDDIIRSAHAKHANKVPEW